MGFTLPIYSLALASRQFARFLAFFYACVCVLCCWRRGAHHGVFPRRTCVCLHGIRQFYYTERCPCSVFLMCVCICVAAIFVFARWYRCGNVFVLTCSCPWAIYCVPWDMVAVIPSGLGVVVCPLHHLWPYTATSTIYSCKH